mgnify:CR=1 FL=1
MVLGQGTCSLRASNVGRKGVKQAVESLSIERVDDGSPAASHDLFLGQSSFAEVLELVGDADLRRINGLDDVTSVFRAAVELPDDCNTQRIAEDLHGGQNFGGLVFNGLHGWHTFIIAKSHYLRLRHILKETQFYIYTLSIDTM